MPQIFFKFNFTLRLVPAKATENPLPLGQRQPHNCADTADDTKGECAENAWKIPRQTAGGPIFSITHPVVIQNVKIRKISCSLPLRS